MAINQPEEEGVIELEQREGEIAIPLEDGTIMYVEAAPPGGALTDAWLAHQSVYKDDDSGDLSQEEVQTRFDQDEELLRALFATLQGKALEEGEGEEEA